MVISGQLGQFAEVKRSKGGDSFVYRLPNA